MKLLFIISGSIAAVKCENILKLLLKRKVYVDCILTDNAKKLIDVSLIKKNILG